MTKKPEGKNAMDLANEAKNAVYEAAGISDTEKLEIIEAEQKGERKIEKLEKIAKESKKITIGGLIKDIACGLGILSIFAGAHTLGCWGLDALFEHNKEYKGTSYSKITKVDGPFFRTTKLEKYDDGKIKITTSGLFKEHKFMTDEDSDGKVDRLHIFSAVGGDLTSFYRNKHFEKHADKFLEADKDFQKQLERFKPHILKYNQEQFRRLYKISEETSVSDICTKADSLVDKGKIKEGIRFLKDAIKGFPKEWLLWDYLGEAYMKLKDYENAVKVFENAVELRPENGWIWYDLSKAYLQFGKPERAIEAAEKATQQYEEPGIFQSLLEDLREKLTKDN